MARGAFNPNIYVTLPGDELLQPTEQEVKAAKAEAGQMRRQERIYTPQELEGYRLHRLEEEEAYRAYTAPLAGNGHSLIPLVRAVSLTEKGSALVGVVWLGDIQRDGVIYRVSMGVQHYDLPITIVQGPEDA